MTTTTPNLAVIVTLQGPVGPAAPYVFAAVSGTLAHRSATVCDSTAGALALTLPALALGQPGWAVWVGDGAHQSPTHHITVTAAPGDALDGVAGGSLVISTAGGSARFVIDAAATGWQSLTPG